MEHRLPNGAVLIVPRFRGDVPTYVPPDRATWKGNAPYPVTPVGAVAAKYLSRARAAIALDETSLDFAGAMQAQAKLEAVTERVHADAGLPETTLVFFDSAAGVFWAYPA